MTLNLRLISILLTLFILVHPFLDVVFNAPLRSHLAFIFILVDEKYFVLWRE